MGREADARRGAAGGVGVSERAKVVTRTQDGAVLPTSSKRADTAEARAERLRERLRQAGIDPDADP